MTDTCPTCGSAYREIRAQVGGLSTTYTWPCTDAWHDTTPMTDTCPTYGHNEAKRDLHDLAFAGQREVEHSTMHLRVSAYIDQLEASEQALRVARRDAMDNLAPDDQLRADYEAALVALRVAEQERAIKGEWLCVPCNTVYPYESVKANGITSMPRCPKCSGFVTPKWSHDLREAERNALTPAETSALCALVDAAMRVDAGGGTLDITLALANPDLIAWRARVK